MAPQGLECLHEILASPLSPQLHHNQQQQQQQQQQLTWLAGRGGRVAETATSAVLRSPTRTRQGQESGPVLAQRLLSSSSSSSQLLPLSVSSSSSSFSLSADRSAMSHNGGRSRGSVGVNSSGLSHHPHHLSSTKGFGSGRGSEGSASNLLGPDLESVIPGDFISDSSNGLSSTRPPPAPHALSIDTSDGLSSLSAFGSNGRANKPSTVYMNRWETKQQQAQQHQYQYSHQRTSLLSEVSRNNKPMGALEVIVKAVEQPTYDDLGSSTFTLPRSPVISSDPHSTSGNPLSSPLGSTGFFSVGSLRHKTSSASSSASSASSAAAHFAAPSSSNDNNLLRGSSNVFSTSSTVPSRTSPSSSSAISLLENSGETGGGFLHNTFPSMPSAAYPAEPSLMYARRSEEFLSPSGLSSQPPPVLTSRDYQHAMSLSPPTTSPTSLSPLANHPNFLSRGNLLQAQRVTSLSAEALSELRHQQYLQQQQQQQHQDPIDKSFSGNTIDFTGNYTIINNNNSLLTPSSLSKSIPDDPSHGLKATSAGGRGDGGSGAGGPGDAAAMPMWVWEIREASGGTALYRPDLISAQGRSAAAAGNPSNLLRHSVESSSSDEVLGIVTHNATGSVPTSGPSGAGGRHTDFRDDVENKPALSIGQLIGGAMKIEPGDWMDYPDQQ